MSDNDKNSKPSQQSLNLPAISKSLSESLKQLDTLSHNSHKQFQDSISIGDTLSKNLSRLNNMIFNLNKTLESFASSKEDFSLLKDSISSEMSLFQLVVGDVKEQVIFLSNINTDLEKFLKSESQTSDVVKKWLLNFQKSLGDILANHYKLLEQIKSLLETLPDKQSQLLSSQIDPINSNLKTLELLLNQNIAKSNDSFSSFTKNSTFFLRFLLLTSLVLFLLCSYSIYLNFSLSKQLSNSIDSINSINQQLESLKPSPTPSPSPTSIPKSNKKS